MGIMPLYIKHLLRLLRWMLCSEVNSGRWDCVHMSALFVYTVHVYTRPPYLHLATSEMWCWSRGRGT